MYPYHDVLPTLFYTPSCRDANNRHHCQRTLDVVDTLIMVIRKQNVTCNICVALCVYNSAMKNNSYSSYNYNRHDGMYMHGYSHAGCSMVISDVNGPYTGA